MAPLPALPPGRYLLTGATGLVGRHVLDLLCDAGVGPVTALFHNAPPCANHSGCRWHRADLSRPEACAAVFADHDYVIHAAGLVAAGPVLARDPVRPMRENLAITGNVLEAAWRAGVKRLVWFSSTTGYPADIADLDEDCMFRGDPPDHWYGLGWAHRHLEVQSRMYAEKVSPAMDVIALRPSLIYGPRGTWDEAATHFIYALVRRVVDRENPITVWGDGSQRRDLIHVRDVARAALHAIARGTGYGAYNIATGESVSVREVLDRLLALEEWREAAVHFDTGRGTGVAPDRRFIVDRAEAGLGFSSDVTLADGLRALIADYRTYASTQVKELRA